ncbi:hypothetical protein LQZ19_08600 [Treponema primitia]|uniref:hypothetical protein n=1 Tax=Treponema primitia TaxID=88058 RepID=UPI00397FAEE7
MATNIDITGKRFGKLTAICYEFTRNSHQFWRCKCDCGKEAVIEKGSLGKGSKSCGCVKREHLINITRKHGKSRERLYIIWNGMIQRCHGKLTTHNSEYQNNSITVCSEWRNVDIFYKWALANGYNERMTIDRIDSNGNYCPENCRWVGMKQQAENRGSTIIIEYNGERLCAADWSKRLGAKHNIVFQRIKRGWDKIKAVSCPISLPE